MGRSIVEVMDRIRVELPEGYSALKSRLASINYQVGYLAPEHMNRAWGELEDALGEHLAGKDDEEWAKKIGRIMRAEE